MRGTVIKCRRIVMNWHLYIYHIILFIPIQFFHPLFVYPNNNPGIFSSTEKNRIYIYYHFFFIYIF